MAVLQLEPLKAVFDKVIIDLNLSTHSVDELALTNWAMEAIDHIGGLNRIPGNKVVTGQTDAYGKDTEELIIQLVDFRAILPKSVISIGEVRFYALDFKDRDDYVLATPTPNKNLDESDKNVYFDYLHWVDGGKMILGLQFNRKDGYILCYGLKMPLYYQNKEEAGIWIPSISSYKEAIYWYITMKLLWRDVFRGRNKQQQLSYAAGMFNNMKNAAYGELMMPDKWELEELANELSLGISYTGLNPRVHRLLSGDYLNMTPEYVGANYWKKVHDAGNDKPLPPSDQDPFPYYSKSIKK